MNLGLYQPLLMCVYVYCFLRLYVYILEPLRFFMYKKNGTSAFYEHASESSPVIMFLYLYEII